MRTLFFNVLELSVTTGLLILLLTFLLKIFGHKMKASSRFTVWLIILFRLLVPIESDYGIVKIYKPVGGTAGGNDVARDLNLYGFLCAVWITVAMILFVLKMAAYLRFMYDQKKSCISYEVDNHKLPVYVCKAVKTPVLCGLVSPKILLPYEICDNNELELILKHELCHYRRLDLWTKFIDNIVKCVYWFNPFVYLLSSQLTLSMEMACDEAVLKNTQKDIRVLYADMMLKVMKGQSTSVYVPMTTGFSSHFSQIKKRFALVLNNHKRRKCFIVVALVILLALLSGTLFGVSFIDNKETEAKHTTESKQTEYNSSNTNHTADRTVNESENDTVKSSDKTFTDIPSAGSGDNSAMADTVSALTSVVTTIVDTNTAYTETQTPRPTVTSERDTITSDTYEISTATDSTESSEITGSNSIPKPSAPPKPSEAVYVNITFDVNGGALMVTDNDIDKGYEIGKAIGRLPVPYRTGFIFDGWWLVDSDGNFTVMYTEDTIVTKECVLVAKWREI